MGAAKLFSSLLVELVDAHDLLLENRARDLSAEQLWTGGKESTPSMDTVIIVSVMLY